MLKKNIAHSRYNITHFNDIMSFGKESSRRRASEDNKEDYLEPSPPAYSLAGQFHQFHDQEPYLLEGFGLGEAYQPVYNPYYCSNYPMANELHKQTLHVYPNNVNNGNQDIAEFFGGEFNEMEDTFRSALMQYFAQVDQEKQGLTDDLRKIKDDFVKYEEEGKRFKVDNIQKGKIIRKLTENGKLFIKEIERLKDELRDTENDRRQIIAENNRLQKRISYESEVIPQLEQELKTLADQNQYLKLLAEDTAKLEEQENKIQHYVKQLEITENHNQQFQNEIQKRGYAVKKLTEINEDLCGKIKELSKVNKINKELSEWKSQYNQLRSDYDQLVVEYRQNNERSSAMSETLNRVNVDFTKCLKERDRLEEESLDLNHENEEKTKLIKILENKLKTLNKEYLQEKSYLQDGEEKIRELERLNEDLLNEKSSLKNDIQILKIKSNSLVEEDTLRNQQFNQIEADLKLLQQNNKELKKEIIRYQNESNDNQNEIDSRIQIEIMLKNQLKTLEEELRASNEQYCLLELKCNQQANRTEHLEKEIMSHVKRESKMEQEVTLTYKTIETLRKSNESCELQRLQIQQELMIAQDSISTLYRQIKEQNQPGHLADTEPNENSIQYEMLQEKYIQCESQRNRLQTDVISLQQQLKEKENECEKKVEELIDHYSSERQEEINRSKTEKENLQQELNSSKIVAERSVQQIHNLEGEIDFLCQKLQRYENYLNTENELLQNEFCGNFQLTIEEGCSQVAEIDQSYFQNKVNGIPMFNAPVSDSEADATNSKNELKQIKIELLDKDLSIRKLERELHVQRVMCMKLSKEKECLNVDFQEVAEEIIYLKNTERELVQALENKDSYVYELKQSVKELETSILEKDTILIDFQSLTEDLQQELNQSTKDKKLTPEIENSVFQSFKEELQTKDEAIKDLEEIVYVLQTKLSHKDSELTEFQEQLQASLTQIKTVLTSNDSSCYKDHQHLLNDLKNKVNLLEKELLNKNPQEINGRLLELKHEIQNQDDTFERQKIQNRCSKADQDKDTSKYHLEEANTKVTIRQAISSENMQKCGNSEQLHDKNLLKYSSTPSHSINNTLDISFHTAHDGFVSKEQYMELVQQLDIKNRQIENYKDHIQILSIEPTASPLNVDSFDSSGFGSLTKVQTEKRNSITKQNLTLPTPMQSVQKEETLHRRSSLPPIPGNTSTTPSMRRRCNSSEMRRRENETVNKGIICDHSQKDRITADDLRKKLVKLSSDLLQKKMEVITLQEELQSCKKKQARVDQPCRSVVQHNEGPEREVHEEQRSQIQGVKTMQKHAQKHQRDEAKQEHFTDDLKIDIQGMVKNYHELVHANDALKNNLIEKNKVISELDFALSESTFELKQSNHTIAFLESELRKQASQLEELKKDLSEFENTTKRLTLNLEQSEKENHSNMTCNEKNNLKTTDLDIQKKELEDDVSSKEKLISRLKDQITINKQEKEISDINLKEHQLKVKTVTEKLLENEKERRRLVNTNDEQEKALVDYCKNLKDAISEKDAAVHNIKLLECQLNELQQRFMEKEENLNQAKLEETRFKDEMAKFDIELKSLNLELKRSKNELLEKHTILVKVENLNDEMNKENERLMHDLIKLKDRIQILSEENDICREKIEKMEKENRNIENLLIKTQKSNSELSEENKCTFDELRVAKNKINQLVQQQEDLEETNRELERKREMIENEFHAATEKLSYDNQELVQDLYESRRTIREFEAILDQGQLDFDEMDITLEKYRQEVIDLDKKLHEIMKQKVALEVQLKEAEEVNTVRSEEMKLVKENIELLQRDKQSLIEQKNDLQDQCVKYKTREEVFENQLFSLEKTLKSREEFLANEKNNKENLQNDVLRLQSELINTKDEMHTLKTNFEKTGYVLSKNNQNLEMLEKTQANLEIEKEELELKTQEMMTKSIKLESDIEKLQNKNDATEDKYQRCVLQVQSLQTQAEEEKQSVIKHTAELDSTIKELQENIAQKEMFIESQNQQQDSLKKDFEELSNKCSELQDYITTFQQQVNTEKQEAAHKIKVLQTELQKNNISRSNDILQLKANLEFLESSKGENISLLRIKLQEVEELKRKLNQTEHIKSQKDTEIFALKDDIIQLQRTLDITENTHNKLIRELEEQKIHIQYLEAQNTNLDDNQIKLIDEKMLLLEEELEGKKQECLVLRSETKDMQNQLSSFIECQEENDNLKSDLENLLTERRATQTKLNEVSNLRTENMDLKSKTDRMQQLIDENMKLEQNLIGVESKYTEQVNKLKSEVKDLRKNVDDLFKKNQDLELRNVTHVVTQSTSGGFHVESKSPTHGLNRLTSKAISVDSIRDVGAEYQFFSRGVNVVAASTPTQEGATFSTVTVNKPSMIEASSSLRHFRSTPSLSSTFNDDFRSTSHFEHSVYPFNEATTTSSIQNRVPTQISKPSKVDASWHKPLPDNQVTTSIKSNPFFQMDKEAVKQDTKSISILKPSSISKSQQSLSVNASMFDMRPKSTEPTHTKQMTLPSSEIGNEFVNRIKATFENR